MLRCGKLLIFADKIQCLPMLVPAVYLYVISKTKIFKGLVFANLVNMKKNSVFRNLTVVTHEIFCLFCCVGIAHTRTRKSGYILDLIYMKWYLPSMFPFVEAPTPARELKHWPTPEKVLFQIPKKKVHFYIGTKKRSLISCWTTSDNSSC